MPLFEQYLYPWLKNTGRELSMLNKIGIGFFIAMIAMLVAAIVEVARVKQSPSNGDYYDVSARDNISPCRNIR